MKTTRIAALATAVALALTASACSPASDDSSSGGKTTVTVKLWDDQVAAAYKQSFAEFTKANPDITVDVQVDPWADYWTKLRTDVSAGNGADIFWLNTAYYQPYADNGNILAVDDSLGDQVSSWQPQVVKQYTRNGKLWGVPQLTDAGHFLYYNKKLVQAAGVDPSKLTWSPSGDGDTLLPALQKLTKDSSGKTADQAGFNYKKTTQWGFNAAKDYDNLILNFVGQNGGTFQGAGDTFTFAGAKSQQSFQYLVDLINKYHVAPTAADTNTNGDFTRDQFIQGKIALFEGFSNNLGQIESGAKFDWGITSLPAGPQGKVTVTNGIIAAANAKSAHLDATKKVLAWMGSAEGNKFVGATGSAIPAVTSAQSTYSDYWKNKGIDTSVLFDSLKNGTIAALQGAQYPAGYGVFDPIFNEIFLGRTPVGAGLQKAQDGANAAMKSGS